MDVSEGREADEALQAGAVDAVLDSPAALEAVLAAAARLLRCPSRCCGTSPFAPSCGPTA